MKLFETKMVFSVSSILLLVSVPAFNQLLPRCFLITRCNRQIMVRPSRKIVSVTPERNVVAVLLEARQLLDVKMEWRAGLRLDVFDKIGLSVSLALPIGNVELEIRGGVAIAVVAWIVLFSGLAVNLDRDLEALDAR